MSIIVVVLNHQDIAMPDSLAMSESLTTEPLRVFKLYAICTDLHYVKKCTVRLFCKRDF